MRSIFAALVALALAGTSQANDLRFSTGGQVFFGASAAGCGGASFGVQSFAVQQQVVAVQQPVFLQQQFLQPTLLPVNQFSFSGGFGAVGFNRFALGGFNNGFVGINRFGFGGVNRFGVGGAGFVGGRRVTVRSVTRIR